MTRSTTTITLLSILLLAACQATGGDPAADSRAASQEVTTDAAKASPGGEATAKAVAPTLKELQATLAKAQEARWEAQRQERYAVAELELARLEIQGSDLGLVESLRAARAKLQEAQSAMERFDGDERPLQIREAVLKVGEAKERLIVGEENLLGILALYAEETEARSMEEIIRRHRAQVETAKERVEIATQKRVVLAEHTLPAKMREKAEAIRLAEAGLAKAEATAVQTRRKSQLAEEKAVDALAGARRDVKKASKKAAAARRSADARREIEAPNEDSSKPDSDPAGPDADPAKPDTDPAKSDK